MSCLPAFPKMDTASVKPLVLLLCFWLRYLVVAADEKDMPQPQVIHRDAQLSRLLSVEGTFAKVALIRSWYV